MCETTPCLIQHPRLQDLVPLVASNIASMVSRSGNVAFQKNCLHVGSPHDRKISRHQNILTFLCLWRQSKIDRLTVDGILQTWEPT